MCTILITAQTPFNRTSCIKMCENIDRSRLFVEYLKGLFYEFRANFNNEFYFSEECKKVISGPLSRGYCIYCPSHICDVGV